MQRLIQQIKRELKKAKHCAVYEEELSRVWPDNRKGREALIALFVRDNGFCLRFYRDGLCAIFDKELRKAKRERSNDRQSHRTDIQFSRPLMHYLRPPSVAPRRASNACQSAASTRANAYRSEEADANSGSMRASGLTMSSANLFRSSFASDSSSSVCCRSSADLSLPSSCANVRTLP